MTTVNFTQRIKDVISRQLTFDFAHLMTEIKEQLDSNDMKDADESWISIVSYNEDIEIRIVTDITPHKDDCDHFPFAFEFEDDCGCSNVRNILFQINIKYKGNHVLCFPMKEMSLEDMLAKIKNDFPKSVLICQCGDKAEEEGRGKCRRCFIHSYTRTEEEGGDCSICLENDGVWIKTKCGHIFHQHCLQKAKAVASLCPICRANIDYHICYHHSHGINPYNV